MTGGEGYKSYPHTAPYTPLLGGDNPPLPPYPPLYSDKMSVWGG